MKTFAAYVIAVLAVAVLGAPPASGLSIERVPQPTTFPARSHCKVDGERRLDGRTLVGKRIERARKIARSRGCEVRVIVRPGKQQIYTGDYASARLNVAIGQRIVRRFKGAF